MRLRIIMIGIFCVLAGAGTADAALVYQRADSGTIVAARDDGSHRHVIARGAQPEVSPDGHWVIFAKPRGEDFDLSVVKRTGGPVRRLMRHFAACTCSPGIPELGIVWSPDSRRVVAQDASNGVVKLIDVLDGSKRDLPFDSGRPSFAPDGARIAGPYGEPGIAVYNIRRRRLRQVTRVGDSPAAWGRGGLAFTTDEGIVLKRRLDQPGCVVKPRTANESFRYAVDWTDAGEKLLVATGPSQFALRASLITPSTGKVVTLAPTFTEVSALAHGGHWILGAAKGDVVAVTPSGKTRVLAHDALSPSWTK